jgi:hypothetical protein
LAQQVAVAGVDLDRVEPRLFRHRGRPGEFGGFFFDLSGGH